MPNVTIYTTGFCPFCYHAKKLLDSKGVPFEEIDVNMTPGARQEMMRGCGGDVAHLLPPRRSDVATH